MHEWSPDKRGVPAGYRVRPEYEMTATEASELLRDGRAVLIDCRTEAEWEAARVEGAVHLPLHELESRVEDIEVEADQAVLVMCHHGVRSLKAALALQSLGFPSARSVVGGIDLWSVVIDPSVPRYERSGPICRVVD